MKRFNFLALAVLTLAACQQNKEQLDPTPMKLQIEPLITKATEVNFEAGDKIGLTVAKANETTLYADNACLTFQDGVFAGELVWYSDAKTESSLYAYYPYNPAGAPDTFSVSTDQTSGVSSSDFMTSSKSGVTPAQSVTMTFKHRMTKIVMKIDNQATSSIKEVALLNTIPSAKVSVAEGTVTAEGEAARITACKVSEGNYAAIVVPQTVAMKLEVVLSDKTVITQPLASMTLASGGQYTIEATIIGQDLDITLSGEIENWSEEGKIGFDGDTEVGEQPASFEEFDTYFVYDDVRYETVTLAGRKWMAEPLRYVPNKMTPSSDPSDKSGLWYPYSSDGTSCTALTDEASIEKLGYLYTAAVAYKAETIDADNYKSFEGVQGICPKGWHIPTRPELVSLCADALKGEGETDTPATNTDAVFYDPEAQIATVGKANEAGFNFTFSGSIISNSYNKLIIDSSVCTVDAYYGNNRMTYVLGSTCNKSTSGNIQTYSMMTTFSKSFLVGKLNAAFSNLTNGVQVRCVKDAE